MPENNPNDDYEDVKFEMKFLRRSEYVDFDDFDYGSEEMRSSGSMMYPVNVQMTPYYYRLPEVTAIPAVQQIAALPAIPQMSPMMTMPQRSMISTPMSMSAMPVQTMMQPTTSYTIPLQMPMPMQMMNTPMMQMQSYQNPVYVQPQTVQTSMMPEMVDDINPQTPQTPMMQMKKPSMQQQLAQMYMNMQNQMAKPQYIPPTTPPPMEIKTPPPMSMNQMNMMKWNHWNNWNNWQNHLKNYAPNFIQKYAHLSNPLHYYHQKYYHPTTTTTTTTEKPWITLTNPWVSFYNNFLKEKLPYIRDLY